SDTRRLGVETLECRSMLASFPIGSPVFMATSSLLSNQREVDVAVADNGDSVAVWRTDASSFDIYARPYFANGTPKTGADILVAGTSANERAPSVGIAPDGSFVVVWEEDGPGPDVVKFRRYSPTGVARSSAVRAEPEATGDHGSPDVAVFDN